MAGQTALPETGTFGQCYSLTLEGFEGVVCLMDDILVHGKTKQSVCSGIVFTWEVLGHDADVEVGHKKPHASQQMHHYCVFACSLVDGGH